MSKSARCGCRQPASSRSFLSFLCLIWRFSNETPLSFSRRQFFSPIVLQITFSRPSCRVSIADLFAFEKALSAVTRRMLTAQRGRWEAPLRCLDPTHPPTCKLCAPAFCFVECDKSRCEARLRAQPARCFGRCTPAPEDENDVSLPSFGGVKGAQIDSPR